MRSAPGDKSRGAVGEKRERKFKVEHATRTAAKKQCGKVWTRRRAKINFGQALTTHVSGESVARLNH